MRRLVFYTLLYPVVGSDVVNKITSIYFHFARAKERVFPCHEAAVFSISAIRFLLFLIKVLAGIIPFLQLLNCCFETGCGFETEFQSGLAAPQLLL